MVEEIVRKIDTNRETTQYLLITNLSDVLRDHLPNKRMDGVRLTINGRNILRRIMPRLQHERIVGFQCTGRGYIRQNCLDNCDPRGALVEIWLREGDDIMHLTCLEMNTFYHFF